MPLSNKIFDKIVLIITSQTLEIHLKKKKRLVLRLTGIYDYTVVYQERNHWQLNVSYTSRCK